MLVNRDISGVFQYVCSTVLFLSVWSLPFVSGVPCGTLLIQILGRCFRTESELGDVVEK